MNREDIIRMAREAELHVAADDAVQKFDNMGTITGVLVQIDVSDLTRFATLVAAEEREACATICDVEADEFGGMSDGFYAAKNSAEAIRARGCL